ncbi:outer membrane lipoprotein-sorting protein [Dysgonomonas alginatilytica]|uniref:Outer membrane lipoprotein-sorting protein n=1 Tax=Dysgonomonas alginatilytica TaxID=1605892 RepID=A0A2V3PPN9_9BACT|nr:LolA-like putative outer membrane lipoprotein chaperone [Dysgonomonas alginatilytica]PXV65427.1 outer membrane lipoprotein-sorting protein [Dysgonomonas alginatilytica]
MKKNLLILAFLFWILGLNAQDAKSILDKANLAYNQAGGITASFTINTEDVKGKTVYSQDGKAYLKGNKFKIDVPDGITWFDGKTQWVYAKGGDEVNVSNPTGEELAGVSPFVLLSLYKTGFKLNYKGEKKEKTKTVYVIEMIPLGKKSEFTKMVVHIDKATNMFTSVNTFGKDGVNNHLIITKLQTGVNLPDNTFVFNKKDYPQIEVIDLR